MRARAHLGGLYKVQAVAQHHGFQLRILEARLHLLELCQQGFDKKTPAVGHLLCLRELCVIELDIRLLGRNFRRL